MRSALSFVPAASFLISSLALTGCSSDGGGSDPSAGGVASVAAPVYAGSTAPATVTATSAETIGRAATEGVNEAVKLQNAGGGIPFAPIGVEAANAGNSALAEKLTEVATEVLRVTPDAGLPTAVVMSSDELNAQMNSSFFCGGSVDLPDNVDQNAAMNFTMTFFDLCYDDGVTPLTMDGALSFSQTDTALTIAFTNFSVNINGATESFTGTFTCSADSFDCSISTDFAGSDGDVFRLENVDVFGNDISGYSLTADFYHNELGMVAITTDLAVTYGSCGAFPDSGIIALAGDGGSSMSITFNPDCSFTVEGFDGSSAFGPETLSWSAI